MSISDPHRLRFSSWWLMILVLTAEFVLFDQFGSHRVTGIYPRWNDQIQYLSEAYLGYEYAHTHGLAAGLWHTLINPSAQGTLHDFAALVAFQFVQPSRSAALALNMLAVIAWQVVLFAVMIGRARTNPAGQSGQGRSISLARDWAFAFAAAMLPVALRGPWLNLPGSAYDFRLDHFALCTLGITSGLAVATQGFRLPGWSAVFGLATAMTLLTRFITGTYLVVVFVAFAIWILLGTDRALRIRNLGLAALIATVLAGPIFWLNREWVWNYYYIGHYIGPESAIRNQNFGLGRSLEFVCGWFADRHVGAAFGLISAVVLIALGTVRFLSVRKEADSSPQGADDQNRASSFRIGDIFVVGSIFLVAPALVLTLHPQKSDVVLSALAPGLVLLVIALWLLVLRGIPQRPVVTRAITLIALASGAASLVYFSVRQFGPADDPTIAANLRQVNGLADYIFDRSQAAKLERPRISVDYITDALDAQVLRVVCYERHHVWKDFDMRLPTGIAEPDAKLVRERIADSDFVFLIGDDVAFGSFPYDRKLREMRPELRTWCDANLLSARRFSFWGHPIILYQRREIPLPRN